MFITLLFKPAQRLTIVIEIKIHFEDYSAQLAWGLSARPATKRLRQASYVKGRNIRPQSIGNKGLK